MKDKGLNDEFNRQVENLIQKGYPGIARVNGEEFRKKIEPLRDKIPSFEPELQQGHILFVIVINSDWVGGEQAMPLVEREGKKGFSVMDDDDIKRFRPIQDPDILKKNNGFSLLGSRCGDRRVTALWISGGKPKLGWCWAGNPHTWLGSASCGSRIVLTIRD